MAYVAVDKDGSEWVHDNKPEKATLGRIGQTPQRLDRKTNRPHTYMER